MKSKIILIALQILIFLSVNLFSQESSQEYYLYVYTTDEKLKPHPTAAGMSNDETLNQIFRDFGVASYYQSFPGAKTPELNHYYEIHFKGNVDSFEELLKKSNIFERIYRCGYYQPATCRNPAIVNDPYDANHLINTNSLDLINAQCAWTITRGHPNVIVGVVDTEFATNHPDLVNTFVGVWGTITDPRLHGTAVSSAVATGTNNGIGIAGVGYNTRIKGYHVNQATVWNGIWQAYIEGFKIINVSWSSIGITGPTHPLVTVVREIVDIGGVVLVLAAGNNQATNWSHEHYATYPGVINVSGVGMDNYATHAHNSWVDVRALAELVTVCVPYGGYSVEYGTSLAAPQVAGVVALMRALKSDLTPAQIENIIKATAGPVTFGNQILPENRTGGRLDAFEAVKAVLCMLPPISFSGTVTTPDSIVNGSSVNVSGTTTVPANRKLTINACGGNVNITGDFTVQPGASLDINVYAP